MVFENTCHKTLCLEKHSGNLSYCCIYGKCTQVSLSSIINFLGSLRWERRQVCLDLNKDSNMFPAIKSLLVCLSLGYLLACWGCQMPCCPASPFKTLKWKLHGRYWVMMALGWAGKEGDTKGISSHTYQLGPLGEIKALSPHLTAALLPSGEIQALEALSIRERMTQKLGVCGVQKNH